MSLFLSLVLAAFVGVLLAWVVGRFTGPRLKPPSPGQASYIAGLKALISGNALLAMKHLREAVEQDSANVDAYIRLGDLLRETGKVEKAVQVHQSLTVRPDLPASVQASVLESLAKDFLAVKKEHKALPVLEDLVSLNSKNAFGYEALSALYEADKRYPEAAKLQARLFELEGTPDKDQLALRYAHLGKAALDAGDRTPAKELFEQALTLSPDSIPSNLYLGDLHFASGAPDQAIACWKKVLDKSAEWAWLTFDRLEAAYFEEGSFESIASVYEGHLARHPKDAKAHVALARIKLKKGQVEAALENARLALEAVPMMPEARAIQIEGLARSGGAEIALSDALALAEDLIERVSRFRCLRCGREESDLRWRCPHCGSFGKMAYLPCAPSS